jgi:hypothetical protein
MHNYPFLDHLLHACTFCHHLSMFRYLTKLDQPSSLTEAIAKEASEVLNGTSANELGVDEAYLPSIDDFVLYVTIRSSTTTPELIVCLIYLSRFRDRQPPDDVDFHTFTPHEVFLAALMLAHKVHEDKSASNARWSECSAIPECSFAGFPNEEVNRIEREFLTWLDWDVNINADQYDRKWADYSMGSSLSPSLQTEPGWICRCCVCVERWASPARGLSHCFACLTPSPAEVEMQKKVLAMEESFTRQRAIAPQRVMDLR